MTLFWCCHREETPGGGWQLKIWSLMSPDVPWFLCFKILREIWNIISPNNFWSLPFRRWTQWAARCSQLTKLYFSINVWYSIIPTASQPGASILRIDQSEAPTEHLNQSLECLRLLRSVSWCSHVCRGPGASSVCTNLDIDMSGVSIGQETHKYQLDNVGDSLLQFSRVMAKLSQCVTYFSFSPIENPTIRWIVLKISLGVL